MLKPIDFTNYYHIINLNFKIDNMQFDAAIDINWQMHAYMQDEEEKKDVVPIEIYCFDHPEWDILMIYKKQRKDSIRINDNFGDYPIKYRTKVIVDINEIIEETKKWIATNIPYDDTI